MTKFECAACALTVIGGLNWGLVALAEFDLVAAVAGLDFGETNALTRAVYGLVGVAAAALAVRLIAGRRGTAFRQPIPSR